MRNAINKELALIVLVIIIILGSGTFYDTFGSEEQEKVPTAGENEDVIKYGSYLTGSYDPYLGTTECEPKSHLRLSHTWPEVTSRFVYAPFVSDTSEKLYTTGRNMSFGAREKYLAYSGEIGQSARSSLLFSRAFQGITSGSGNGVSGTNKSQDHGSLAEKATDPTSNLIQFRMQNNFVPESYDSSGYSNLFEIQPVIPWKAPWGQLMITRPTIPFPIPTANPDGPFSRTSGMGDIDLLHLFINKKKWGATGLGFNAVFPTATDRRLGSGKWQAGPAGVLVYKGIPKWQLGGLVYNNWSFDTNRHGKENVNKMYLQWIATYHFKPGWYVGWGDLPMTFNWKNGKQDIPLCAKLGHVTKIGKQPVDMFIQPFYTPSHDGASGEWGFKFNLGLLIPE